jgi:HSP20 family protein
MPLVKWDPLREMDHMLDRYSRDLLTQHGMDLDLFSRGDWAPRVDIAETEKAFIIKMEIPEVDKKDVKIHVEHGILAVKGERKQEKEEAGKKFHRIERCYGSFCRSFTLPKSIDEGKIEAKFKDGMLTIELPKIEQPKSTPIEIKVG